MLPSCFFYEPLGFQRISDRLRAFETGDGLWSSRWTKRCVGAEAGRDGEAMGGQYAGKEGLGACSSDLEISIGIGKSRGTMVVV